MKKICLDSGCISTVSFDVEAKRMTLTFRKDQSRYLYEGVSAETYARLMNTDSHGSFFNQKIRSQFKGRRLV